MDRMFLKDAYTEARQPTNGMVIIYGGGIIGGFSYLLVSNDLQISKDKETISNLTSNVQADEKQARQPHAQGNAKIQISLLGKERDAHQQINTIQAHEPSPTPLGIDVGVPVGAGLAGAAAVALFLGWSKNRFGGFGSETPPA